MYTIFGIPNCDTVKKAINWLKENKIDYQFHDYKISGIDAPTLQSWTEQVNWEIIFNKRSTTYKELPASLQKSITTAAKAIPVMQEHTSIIKRPVIVKKGKVVAVGFDEKKYEAIFG
ncbi:ArsC family reductase [Sediminibacterium sp. KACHI17]|jgi:arsenate reductase (glutaredoxin)|uniref:ArsC family reductase n=1 Tax=Sediminibacterium sp. KACHI17 TaxID=1751071 RepID=A0AAT9GFG6_9BACT